MIGLTACMRACVPVVEVIAACVWLAQRQCMHVHSITVLFNLTCDLDRSNACTMCNCSEFTLLVCARSLETELTRLETHQAPMC